MTDKQSLQEWFAAELDALKTDPVFILEDTLLQFTDKMAEEMANKGMSKSDLAQKLNKKPSFIKRVLQGDSEIPLSTMVQIMIALNLKLDFHFTKLDYR